MVKSAKMDGNGLQEKMRLHMHDVMKKEYQQHFHFSESMRKCEDKQYSEDNSFGIVNN